MRISDWSSDVCSSDLAAGLHAGVARGEELAPAFTVDLVGDLQAAAELQPGVLLLRVEAERHRGQELGGGKLALPVVGRPVDHLDGPAGDRVHGLERSEGRRVGKVCVRTARSRWSPTHQKK